MKKRIQLIIATSQRQDGPMGFIKNTGSKKTVNNRERFLRRFGISPKNLARGRQVHGNRVVAVNKVSRSGLFRNTDALITNKPNTFLAVLTADCFPVFFYDTGHSVVGIAHAGWRGIVKGIVSKTIFALRRHYLVDLKVLKVVIGPGIQKCHFEIWPRSPRHQGLMLYLRRYRRFIEKRNGRVFMDLVGIIKYQLAKSGVSVKHIRVSADCTYHMPHRFFSYRRDKSAQYPRGLGNMISIIGFKLD